MQCADMSRYLPITSWDHLSRSIPFPDAVPLIIGVHRELPATGSLYKAIAYELSSQ